MDDRDPIERRLDELARQHSGRAFADSVRAYSASLDEPAREELKRILLARAASVDQTLMEQVGARGWFRRQRGRASTSSLPGDHRER